MDAVKELVTAFPNGGTNAGGGYLGALAATLCEYPRSVAVKCCDPVRGCARETRFLPTVADVVAFCERETDAMRRSVDAEDRHARILREMAERREEMLPRDQRPSYEELKAKYGPTWGIRQNVDAVRHDIADAARVHLTKVNATMHQRELAAAGLAADSIVSAALVRSLREKGIIADRPCDSEAAA